HRHVTQPRLAQPLDGQGRGVHLAEDAEDAFLPRGAHCPASPPADGAAARRPRNRRGGGSTSFSSAIETGGNTRMNSRNHMKNQPKLPTRIAISTHAGW